ncbi:hypothetical protein KC336_g20861, partial [Hortaea werneckii]
LDPQWRDQHRLAQQRSSTTNLSTQDVADNLKRLASQRTDLFDPVTGQAITAEEQERRKRVELGSYDGVGAAQQQQQAGGAAAHGLAPGTMGVGGENRPQGVDEQVRRLHQKYA